MTKITLFAVTFLALISLTVAEDFMIEEIKPLWSIWKDIHQKTYSHEEEATRFEIFYSNYVLVESNNRRDTGFKLALNEFADMTDEEFRNKYIQGGLRMDEVEEQEEEQYPVDYPALDLPERWDWREHGAVTAPKNQGKCGSCWSFSASGALESLYFNTNKKLVSFSEQQMVDCDRTDHACKGGLPWNAFEYTARKGLETEEDYPYTATKAWLCKYKKTKALQINPGGYKRVPFNNPTALKAASVVQTISVGVQADQPVFRLYKSGVISAEAGCTSKLNHGVLVVGYDVTDGVEGFIVKNSWSEQWGDNGYLRISTEGSPNKGQGVCGILALASYPVV